MLLATPILWPHLLLQDDHNDELEEFFQSANHLHDINKKKKNNGNIHEEKSNREIVSNLIEFDPAKREEKEGDNNS